MADPVQKLSRGRILLFRTILLLLPIFLLALVEAGLRLAGAGKEVPLFTETAAGEDFLHMHEQVARRYFIDPKAAPAVSYPSFRKEKKKSTFRVVVQGASTAAGIPYKHGGSFPAMLEQRLQTSMPAAEVEVINTAITAVCSFTLLDLAEEIIRVDPDAVIVYAGHNEYYGALGAASSQQLGSSGGLVRFYLGLSRLRLVGAIRNYHAGRSARRTADIISRPNSTLMERMVLESEIPYGSKLYRKGILQYHTNLELLARKYRKAGIPLFLCTLVSNQRDLEPFVSRSGEGEESAAVHFRAGQEAFREGDYDAAAAHFQGAADLDLLRFRAPSALNPIISQVAEQEGATLIAMEQLFREHSPGGIIGKELMTEHVHPTLHGYFLMADACYTALHARGLGAGYWEQTIPAAEAREMLPVTRVDSLYGCIGVEVLLHSWPFTDQRARKIQASDYFSPVDWVDSLALDLFLEKTSWLPAMNELYRYYLSEEDYRGALSVARALQIEMRYSAIPLNMQARAWQELGDPGKALQTLQGAYEKEALPEIALNLGRSLVRMGEISEALPYLEVARSKNSLTEQAEKLLQPAREILRLEQEIYVHKDSTELLLRAAYGYLLLENEDVADSLVQVAYRQDPGNPLLRKLYRAPSDFPLP